MRYRLAMLVAALLAAATTEAQVPKAGEGPVTIEADRIQGIDGLELSAEGNAELRRDDLTIFGQTLRYNRELGRVEATGGVRLQMGADRFFGPSLLYDTIDDTGVFPRPTYELRSAGQARGHASAVEFLGPGKYRLKNATFTTCAPGNDDWELEANEIDLDYGTEKGRASLPRLRFFDTTILAFPFAAFPLSNRRKSGLLAPYFAQSTRRGFEVGIPYYWNIAPERDATFTPVYMTKRGLQLRTEFRYLAPSYSGETRYEILPHDRQFGGERYGLSMQHVQHFTPNLVGQLDYSHVSDSRYFVDLSSEVRQASVGNLNQDGYLYYHGSMGRGSYGIQARVQAFQTLQDPLAPVVPPYHRVPQLTFTSAYNDIGGLLDSSFPAEYVRFTHPTLIEGSRTSLSPTLAAPLLAPGWFLTPKIGVRYVDYSLDLGGTPLTSSPNVTIPWLSVDSGLIFDRPIRWFGSRFTQTLEPRAYYVYVPYRNQDQIPLFDTALADFNYAQLFSENRFVGGDRFGDANQLTLAVTSRFLQPDGQERFRATIGQRFRFKEERVGLTPDAPPLASGPSDILASVGGQLGRGWTVDVTGQYNPHSRRPERYDASVRYSPEIAKVLNLGYRYDAGILRAVDLSGQWPVSTGWYAVGRYNYSLLDKRLLEGLGGIEYNGGCWVLRVVVQRLQVAAEVASTSFYFQLELSGVGSVGTDEAVQLFKRDVPGYSVTNPKDERLVPPSLVPQLPYQQVF